MFTIEKKVKGPQLLLHTPHYSGKMRIHMYDALRDMTSIISLITVVCICLPKVHLFEDQFPVLQNWEVGFSGRYFDHEGSLLISGLKSFLMVWASSHGSSIVSKVSSSRHTSFALMLFYHEIILSPKALARHQHCALRLLASRIMDQINILYKLQTVVFY